MVLRDTGKVERGTSCRYREHEAAERALQAYLAAKHTPNFGRGEPATAEITDVLKLYADEHAAWTKRSVVAWSALPHLIEFFADDKVAHATPNLWRAYAEWRKSRPRALLQFGAGYRYGTEVDVPRGGDQTGRRVPTVLSAARASHARSTRCSTRCRSPCRFHRATTTPQTARMPTSLPCQGCHMLHDRPKYLCRRWHTLYRRKGLGDLSVGSRAWAPFGIKADRSSLEQESADCADPIMLSSSFRR